MKNITIKQKERFISKIIEADLPIFGISTKCRVLDSKNKTINPGFNFGPPRGTVRASRASWEIFFGKVDVGKCVVRRCNNKNCINPDHLYLGSKGDARVEHIVDDSGIRFKPCSICKQWLEYNLENFAYHSKTTHNLGARCRPCDVVISRKSESKNWPRLMLYRCQDSAKTKEFECTITEEEIKMIYLNQGGRCFWTGVIMEHRPIHRYPYKPSPDRLDRNKGYTKDNVVLCCMFMNVGRNSCNLDVFIPALKENLNLFGKGLWRTCFE